MPLDSATRTDAIAEAFDAIILTPRPKGNSDAVAAEYYVASVLLSRAEKRREAATKAATAAGVLPDHAKAPLSVGTHPRVYAGELVEISATVVEQATKLDGEGLAADLAALVKPAVLKRLVAKHTRRFNPSHRYSASLVNGDAPR